MAFGNATFADAGGAVSDIFGGLAGLQRAKGYRAEAAGFTRAAGLAGENVDLEKVATSVQETQSERKALKIIGGQMSDVAGAGFASSGTALDLLAESNRQASLEQALIGTQGEIQEHAYEQQQTSFLAQAEAATSAAKASSIASTGQFIGAGLKSVAAIATLL